MADEEGADQTQSRMTSNIGRLRWSEEMDKVLLECKSKAKQLNESENLPRNANGRKKGYMKIMKELWDELGYAEMHLTSQNLRDQAARLEKRSGNVRETIVESVGIHRDRESGRENTESAERINIEEQRHCTAQCRLCGKATESVSHILAGCSALAQTKYLARHNAALKILYFEMLRDRELVQTVPPWYSPAMTKPLYENDNATALWDVPLYAENINVRANRIDARIVDKNAKKVIAIEMSCP